jgi:hypothetical protein
MRGAGPISVGMGLGSGGELIRSISSCDWGDTAPSEDPLAKTPPAALCSVSYVSASGAARHPISNLREP